MWTELAAGFIISTVATTNPFRFLWKTSTKTGFSISIVGKACWTPGMIGNYPMTFKVSWHAAPTTNRERLSPSHKGRHTNQKVQSEKSIIPNKPKIPKKKRPFQSFEDSRIWQKIAQQHHPHHPPTAPCWTPGTSTCLAELGLFRGIQLRVTWDNLSGYQLSPGKRWGFGHLCRNSKRGICWTRYFTGLLDPKSQTPDAKLRSRKFSLELIIISLGERALNLNSRGVQAYPRVF